MKKAEIVAVGVAGLLIAGIMTVFVGIATSDSAGAVSDPLYRQLVGIAERTPLTRTQNTFPTADVSVEVCPLISRDKLVALESRVPEHGISRGIGDPDYWLVWTQLSFWTCFSQTSFRSIMITPVGPDGQCHASARIEPICDP